MKKFTLFVLIIVAAFSFSACSGNSTEASANEETTISVTEPETTKPQIMKVTDIKCDIEIRDANGNACVTAEDFKSAEAKYYEDIAYYGICFDLNEEGTQKFADATAAMIGETMDLVIDGEVIFSPVVNSQIIDGKFQVEDDDFTREKINDILLKLQGEN